MDFLRYIQTIWTMALSVFRSPSCQMNALSPRRTDSHLRNRQRKTVKQPGLHKYVRAVQMRIRGHSFRVFVTRCIFVIPTIGGISSLTNRNVEIPPMSDRVAGAMTKLTG
ncbi:hypothetical protein [Spirosoma litoris]